MNENDQDQNNKKFMKENKVNSCKADWDFAMNKVNEDLLKTI